MRPQFVSEPSSSAKQPDGSRNTSVSIFAVSTGLNSPAFRQNVEVSVTSGSMTTRNFSFESASMFFALFGAAASGLKPWQMYPFIFPWCMRSNTARRS